MSADNGCLFKGGGVCGNSRTSNSSLCYMHSMQRVRNNDAQPSTMFAPSIAPEPSINLSPYSNDDDAVVSMHDVFDDFSSDGELSTSTFTNEASNVIRSAVTSEFMRNADRLNLGTDNERVDATQGMAEYLTSTFQIRSNTMNADDAYELSHSSADRYGRSLEDASHLAGFALRQKYQYGRMRGLDTDENGVPFSLPEEEFIKAHEDDMRQEVPRQLAVECYRYNETYRAQFGKAPKVDAPIANPALRRLARESDMEPDLFASISPAQEQEQATNFILERMNQRQEVERQQQAEVERQRQEHEARRAEIAENERLQKEIAEKRRQTEERHNANTSDPFAEMGERQRMSEEEERRSREWEAEQEKRDRRAETAKKVSEKVIKGFFNGVEKRAEKHESGARDFWNKQEDRKREKESAKHEKERRESQHLQDRANEEMIRNFRRRGQW